MKKKKEREEFPYNTLNFSINSGFTTFIPKDHADAFERDDLAAVIALFPGASNASEPGQRPHVIEDRRLALVQVVGVLAFPGLQLHGCRPRGVINRHQLAVDDGLDGRRAD